MADPERFDADPALSIKIRMLLSKTFINTTSIITSFFSNISLKFIDLKRSLEKGVYKFHRSLTHFLNLAHLFLVVTF